MHEPTRYYDHECIRNFLKVYRINMSIALHCLKLYRKIKMNLRFCMCMCYRKGSRHVQDLNSLGNNAKSGGGG